jgi:hypothetical protein
LRYISRGLAGVDVDRAEVVTEARFKQGPHRLRQGLATAPHSGDLSLDCGRDGLPLRGRGTDENRVRLLNFPFGLAGHHRPFTPGARPLHRRHLIAHECRRPELVGASRDEFRYLIRFLLIAVSR